VVLQLARALRVVVTRERVVVRLGAVGFDDQVAVRPAEVGDVVAEALIDERVFEAGLADEVEDEVFELVGGGLEVGCDGSELRGSCLCQVFGRDETLVERGSRGSSERVERQHRGEVDQRSQRGCDGDALVEDPFRPGGSVDAKPGVSALRRGVHVDRAAVPREEVPERACRVTAEGGVGPARFRGREEARFGGERAVSDGIDAAVLLVQVPLSQPRANLVAGHAARAKLGRGDDAALPRRELGNFVGGLSRVGRLKTPRIGHRASLARHLRRNNARLCQYCDACAKSPSRRFAASP
jgi:hypothetical protein